MQPDVIVLIGIDHGNFDTTVYGETDGINHCYMTKEEFELKYPKQLVIVDFKTPEDMIKTMTAKIVKPVDSRHWVREKRNNWKR